MNIFHSKILIFMICVLSDVSLRLTDLGSLMLHQTTERAAKEPKNDVSRRRERAGITATHRENVFERNKISIFSIEIFDFPRFWRLRACQIDGMLSPTWMATDASKPGSRRDPSAARWHRSMSVLKVLGPRCNILFRAVESPQNEKKHGTLPGPRQKTLY